VDWDSLWQDCVPERTRLMLRRVNAAEHRANNALALADETHTKLEGVKVDLARANERIKLLQAQFSEEGYWEKQWRNEAAARQWAEAKLSEKRASVK